MARIRSVAHYGRRIFWLRSFKAAHFGRVFSGARSNRPLRVLWTVLVHADSVPDRSACCGGNCAGGNNCQCGRVSRSNVIGADEGSVRH